MKLRNNSYLIGIVFMVVCGECRAQDAPTFHEIATLEHGNCAVTEVTFNSSGDTIATLDKTNHRATVWDNPQQPAFVIHDVRDGISFSRDGKTLAVGMRDRIELWSVSGKSKRTQLNMTHVEALTYSPNGKWLAACDNVGNVKVWHADNGELRASGKVADFWACSLDFSEDGLNVVVGGTVGAGARWAGVVDVRIEQGRLLLRNKYEHPNPSGRKTPLAVFAVKYGPKHGPFVVSAGMGGFWTINGVNTAYGKSFLKLRDTNITGMDIAPGSIPNSMLIAICGEDKAIDLWRYTNSLFDKATMIKVTTLKGHKDKVCDVTFHPGGQLLGSAGFDGTVKLWNIPRLTK